MARDVNLTVTRAQAETVQHALEWALVHIRNGDDLPGVERALALRVLVKLHDALEGRTDVR